VRIDQTDRIAAADALLSEWESTGYIDNTAAAAMRWALGLITHGEYQAQLHAVESDMPEGGK